MASYRNSDPLPPELEDDPLAALPRDSWDLPPWNRWSFQHVTEFLNTAEIAASTRPLALPRSRHHGALDDLVLESGSSLDDWMDATWTDGLLVWHRDGMVLERYCNGMTPATLHLSQSMAKSVTGLVAGCLMAGGQLARDQHVTAILPELEHTGWRGATLGQVLDMTTGVAYDETYTDDRSDVALSEVAAGWKPAAPGVAAPASVWEQVLTLQTCAREHGDRWLYRSIETDVLAFCLERVTGQRLDQLVSTFLWEPIGAEHPAAFTIDATGYPLADGGFNATLRDYARFGLVMLRGGCSLDDTRIVPAAFIDDTRAADHASFARTGSVGLPDGAYRNQFWIEDSHERALLCVGIFGQLIYINPERELLVVKLSTWPTALDPDFKVATLGAIHDMATHLERVAS